MPEDDVAGWQETAHLLGNPQNAERLLRSIRSADAGGAEERRLAPAEQSAERRQVTARRRSSREEEG